MKPQHAPLIMVVDDDADSLSILVRYLRREGLEVILASSATECLNSVAQSRPDVIIMDLMMPEMDGFALCRTLRANPSTTEIPVIMLTARNDIDARAEGIEVGISDFIAKPVLRRELSEKVRAQLRMLAADRANFATLDQLSRSTPGWRNKL
jgi:DNA-binding response OmpR family regulator